MLAFLKTTILILIANCIFERAMATNVKNCLSEVILLGSLPDENGYLSGTDLLVRPKGHVLLDKEITLKATKSPTDNKFYVTSVKRENQSPLALNISDPDDLPSIYFGTYKGEDAILKVSTSKADMDSVKKLEYLRNLETTSKERNFSFRLPELFHLYLSSDGKNMEMVTEYIQGRTVLEIQDLYLKKLIERDQYELVMLAYIQALRSLTHIQNSPAFIHHASKKRISLKSIDVPFPEGTLNETPSGMAEYLDLIADESNVGNLIFDGYFWYLIDS